jgi:hypothetical protein
LRKNNSFFSIQIDIFKLKPFQLKMEQINIRDSHHPFTVVLNEEKPLNWNKIRMALMLCNISLPRGTQLPHMLIKYILEFIRGSFVTYEPYSSYQTFKLLPPVVIDKFDNIWTKCKYCDVLSCFYVPDDWVHLINCKLQNGDITTARCYDCEYRKWERLQKCDCCRKRLFRCRYSNYYIYDDDRDGDNDGVNYDDYYDDDDDDDDDTYHYRMNALQCEMLGY